MNSKFKLALHIAGISLLLGVLGDALLRVGPWGLNIALWTLAFLVATLGLMALDRLPLESRAAGWVPVLLLGAAGLAWRDSPVLKLLALAAVALSVAFGTWQARGIRLAMGALSDRLARLFLLGIRIAGGCLPLLTPAWGWPPESKGQRLKQAGSVAMGALIGLPLVLLFGALFSSADLVFNSMIHRLFRFDVAEVASHVLLTAVCAWAVAGYYASVLWREDKEEKIPGLPQFVSLGPVEAGVALGLLNLLFLAFIAVQVRYLFGGAELVRITPDLTYAEYARQGFFQLVAAAALAWLILWTADWLLGTSRKKAFRIQALALIAMMLVLLASAFYRMRLYQAEYGWTELRFYVTAFMIWLVAVLAWFVATVVRGARDRFLFGAAVIGLIAVGVLHVMNPDAWISHRNLTRLREGQTFDAAYAARLSADAAPVLAAALSELAPADRAILVERLARWASKEAPDWRLWSWSRAQARKAARAELLALEEKSE